jgi:uncharacterized membrane protein YgcG
MSMPHRPGSQIVSISLAVALISFAIVGSLLHAPGIAAQDTTSFPPLQAEQQVYDETGRSLSGEQAAALRQQIDGLASIGASVVVYVRALDATPEETLEQVEALQQAWVAAAGVDQETAVAILINRNPDDPNDARAGIFVGRTYNEGNVPEDEQRAIVDDALIPPLRDGDVYGSASSALERLDSSIRNGPPKSAFEVWSRDAGESWLPWVMVAAAVAGIVPVVRTNRQVRALKREPPPPTTVRPGDLSPAMAGALVAGSPQPSATPAMVLDLAARGALAIEPERDDGVFRQDRIQVRLLDRERINDEIEAALWNDLESRADDGVVSSKELGRLAQKGSEIRNLLRDGMRGAGWLDDGYNRRLGTLAIVAIAAVALLIFTIVVAVQGATWWPVVGAGALACLIVAAGVVVARDSSLTLAAQDVALPWRAYKEGIKQATRDMSVPLDLDRALPDAVAMNLGSGMEKRLEHAFRSGIALRVFSSTMHAGATASSTPGFMIWPAFSSTMATSSASSTVSSGGSGGGGGAAGST